ncbi:MAG: hypothetical protein JWM93_320 [Frankiales bacterium]|nr:hypothetical protein [Frankiales bacterium]
MIVTPIQITMRPSRGTSAEEEIAPPGPYQPRQGCPMNEETPP